MVKRLAIVLCYGILCFVVGNSCVQLYLGSGTPAAYYFLAIFFGILNCVYNPFVNQDYGALTNIIHCPLVILGLALIVNNPWCYLITVVIMYFYMYTMGKSAKSYRIPWHENWKFAP